MVVPSPGDGALLVIPPKRVCDRIDTWRRRYMTDRLVLRPHITVVYPPFVPESQWWEAKAEVTDRVEPGLIFSTFHFPESTANFLTSSALDPLARIPEFKVCAVKVEAI